MKKTINVVLTTLSILIFLASMYILVGSTLAIKNNELFRVFGYSFAVVPTSSMEGSNPDSFNAGSAVITYYTKYEDLKIGDVVVYKSDTKQLIIHRIIEEVSEGFIVKGDNNPVVDNELVTSANYQGKYYIHFDFFNIGVWLTDSRNILLLIVVIILFAVIIHQIVHIIIQVNKEKLRKYEESLKEEEKKNDKGSN